ncbi:hypothetical protein IF188_01655 [Microbacterium sp. NEAU-LLC]|uniref:Sugar ABC transporter ATPase n=1 Tax=Microbacterium helvum TaxID=2773713 RepID=A0ABR8NI79_9MICO|nr:hypothetical protein [Microbacterium helvum]MBD3940404.1 hypothetical protein [Microbacterium helvum]
MTNPLPYEGPVGDEDEEVLNDGAAGDADADLLGLDDDRPLDPDRNDDQIDSAAADERAATEGTIDVADLP